MNTTAAAGRSGDTALVLAVWVGIVDVAVVALLWGQVARALIRCPGQRVPARRLEWGRLAEESQRLFLGTRFALVVLFVVMAVMCSHVSRVAAVVNLAVVFLVATAAALVTAFVHNRAVDRRSTAPR